MHQCNHCFKPFKSIVELKDHLKDQGSRSCRQLTTEEPGYFKQPYKCIFCPKKFLLEENKKQHVNILHTCEFCNQTVTNLRGHILQNHRIMVDYSCDICNGTFSTSYKLTSHIVHYHHPKELYNCRNCDQIFCKLENSLTHSRVVHKHLSDSDKEKINTLEQAQATSANNPITLLAQSGIVVKTNGAAPILPRPTLSVPTIVMPREMPDPAMEMPTTKAIITTSAPTLSVSTIVVPTRYITLGIPTRAVIPSAISDPMTTTSSAPVTAVSHVHKGHKGHKCGSFFDNVPIRVSNVKSVKDVTNTSLATPINMLTTSSIMSGRANPSNTTRTIYEPSPASSGLVTSTISSVSSSAQNDYDQFAKTKSDLPADQQKKINECQFCKDVFGNYESQLFIHDGCFIP